MRVGQLEVRWIRDHVEITGPGGLLARGRWRGGTLVDRSGPLASSDWSAIEHALRKDAERLLSETFAVAHDERGVDVTQIDWMLSLSPIERLKALDTYRNSLLRLIGDAPRD